MLVRAIVAATAMLTAAALAAAITPRAKLADQAPRIELARVVPTEFGSWRVDQTLEPLGPVPAVAAALEKAYDQTLARTYADAAGNRHTKERRLSFF